MSVSLPPPLSPPNLAKRVRRTSLSAVRSALRAAAAHPAFVLIAPIVDALAPIVRTFVAAPTLNTVWSLVKALVGALANTVRQQASGWIPVVVIQRFFEQVAIRLT